jgi:hypothetical protein
VIVSSVLIMFIMLIIYRHKISKFANPK